MPNRELGLAKNQFVEKPADAFVARASGAVKYQSNQYRSVLEICQI